MSVERKEQVSVVTAEVMINAITEAILAQSGQADSPSRRLDIGSKVQAVIGKRVMKQGGGKA